MEGFDQGLVLLGSENPLSYNRDFQRPIVDTMRFVHASGDRVVHPEVSCGQRHE
jgi:hypothetical protein